MKKIALALFLILAGFASAQVTVTLPAPYGKTIYVDSARGVDSTGIVGSPLFPFKTLPVAWDSACAVGGALLNLGAGSYDMPVTDVDQADPYNVNPASKMCSGIILFGQGIPTVNADTTALIAGSGTRLVGQVTTSTGKQQRTRPTQVYNLGIDVGKTVTTARYAGLAVDPLAYINIGQLDPATTKPVTGIVVLNVLTLARSKFEVAHNIIVENDRNSMITATMIYAPYGFVSKSIGGIFNINANSHGYDCGLVKGNGYATSENTILNINMRDCPENGYDGGLWISTDVVDTTADGPQVLTGVIVNATADSASNVVHIRAREGVSGSIRNVMVNAPNIRYGQIYGSIDYPSVFINSKTLSGKWQAALSLSTGPNYDHLFKMWMGGFVAGGATGGPYESLGWNFNGETGQLSDSSRNAFLAGNNVNGANRFTFYRWNRSGLGYGNYAPMAIEDATGDIKMEGNSAYSSWSWSDRVSNTAYVDLYQFSPGNRGSTFGSDGAVGIRTSRTVGAMAGDSLAAWWDTDKTLYQNGPIRVDTAFGSQVYAVEEDVMQFMNDADVTLGRSVERLYTTANSLTFPRTVTLLEPSVYGYRCFSIGDESGAINGVNTITIDVDGSAAISGAGSVVLPVAYATVRLCSNPDVNTFTIESSRLVP